MVKVRLFCWCCCICCIVLLTLCIIIYEPAMTTTKFPLVGWLQCFELNWTEKSLLTNRLPILRNLADSKALSATCTNKTQHCWQKTLGIHSFPLLATAAITGPHHWQKTSGIPSSSDATAACPCWGGATLSRGRGRGCLFWSTHDQWPCQPETTGTRKDFKSMSHLHSLC